MPAHEAAVNADAPLTGRNLEPWRGLLAVAHWLDSLGEPGLHQRMCDLAQSYQTERKDLEASDLTRLVVRALCDVVPFVHSVPFVHRQEGGVPIDFDVRDVVDSVNRIARDEDLADADAPPYANGKRVGRVLTALRIRHATRTAKGKRRQITPDELSSLATSYGLPVPFAVHNPPPNCDYAHYAQTAQRAQPDPASTAGPHGSTLPEGREVFEL